MKNINIIEKIKEDKGFKSNYRTFRLDCEVRRLIR
jgi:hypothetical protein